MIPNPRGRYTHRMIHGQSALMKLLAMTVTMAPGHQCSCSHHCGNVHQGNHARHGLIYIPNHGYNLYTAMDALWGMHTGTPPQSLQQEKD